MNEDLSLLITVYKPYEHLLDGTLVAIRRWWDWPTRVTVYPREPDLLHLRMLAGLRIVLSPFVIILHEDYRLCGPVKQDQLDECLNLMRGDPSVLSCSLTWEPVAKKPYKDTKFEELPVDSPPSVDCPTWPFAVNFQARVWRTERLTEILEALPETATHFDFEPMCGEIFRKTMYPEHRVISYPIPAPPNPSGHVDKNDKSEWIIPYDNLIFQGKPRCP